MAKPGELWKVTRRVEDLFCSGCGGGWRLAWMLLAAAVVRVTAQADQAIYTDSLQNGWADWGWATLNYNSTVFVHSCSKSIGVTITDASSQAIYIHHDAFDSSFYTNLTFWINGGTNGGQQLKVQAILDLTAQSAANLPALAANTWQPITLSLSSLGVAGQLTRLGPGRARLSSYSIAKYGLQADHDWQYLQTNTLASNSLQIILPATDSARFYRARWLP